MSDEEEEINRPPLAQNIPSLHRPRHKSKVRSFKMNITIWPSTLMTARRSTLKKMTRYRWINSSSLKCNLPLKRCSSLSRLRKRLVMMMTMMKNWRQVLMIPCNMPICRFLARSKNYLNTSKDSSRKKLILKPKLDLLFQNTCLQSAR